MQTHDPYLFGAQFFDDMVARLSGPGRLRFIMQPAVALFLGIRDGKSDTRMGRPPFLSALLFYGATGQLFFGAPLNLFENWWRSRSYWTSLRSS